MVVYVASRLPLTLIPWREDAPAFSTVELTEDNEAVRQQFALPHVVYAGSHTCCGCGFNEGRGYLQTHDDQAKERIGALESSRRLAEYVRQHQVEQIYSCWSGDEAMPREFERRVTLGELVAPEFLFRERELITIDS